MSRRRAWWFFLLVTLGVLWLGACQAPLGVGDVDPRVERPANDHFADRAALVGAAGTAAGSSVGASAEVGEPDHGGAAAGRSVWWSWTAPADGTAAFEVRGSGFEAVLGAYRGAVLATLVVVEQIDATDLHDGVAAFEVAAGDVVAIAVDGIDGGSGTIALAWTLEAPEPDPEPEPEPEPEFPLEGAFAPATLSFAGMVDGHAPEPLTVTLTSTGEAQASFELASDRAWLSVTPNAGTLAAGASAELSVAVAACTAAGSQSGSLVVVGSTATPTLVVRRECSEPVPAPTLDLAIDRVYVTQSVPAQDSARPAAERVPLVAGRPGLLRVFVTANEPNLARPLVRLHVRHGGGPQTILDLSGPDAVPLTVDEGVLGQTYVVELPADVVRLGLEAYVTVSGVGDTDPGNDRFPAAGVWVPDVVVAPEARFTLVPIAYRGTTPDVGDGSAYLGLTERMFPLAAVDVEVRAPVSFTGDLGSGSGWGQLLQELTSLRVADGSTRHYYGVVNPGYGGGIAGIAWMGHRPVAVGWHHLPSGASVAAHELGHNWGRPHAPCGVTDDATYPYPGGVTGVWGFDRGTGRLKGPTLADVMGYCSPVWNSDYTYRGVLDFRVSYGYTLAGLSATASTTLLLASGRIDDDAATLDPLFVLEGRPQAVATGPYALVGRGADGTELLRVAFDAADVSLEHGHAFHLAIPIAADLADRVREYRVERDGTLLAERRLGIRTLTVAPTEVTEQPDGGVTIAWDTRAYAELLARDGEGGSVVGRDRSGRLTVRPTGRELELLFSDGVTTQRRIVRY